MAKNTRKIKDKEKAFIDASIIEYRYFDTLKRAMAIKYQEIITSKKEIKKMHDLLESVVATDFSTIRNIKWLLEKFSKNDKYKIIEEKKNVQYCVKKKLHVITMDSKMSTKIKLKGGNVVFLTNKLQKVKRPAAVIDTCAFGAKNIEDVVKNYKTLYVVSTVIKERGRLNNRNWPELNIIPIWIKESPALIPDDNILIFCSENNLELLTADRLMSAKADAHGIKCKLLSHSYPEGDESHNLHQTQSIQVQNSTPRPKVKDTTRQVATRVQFTGFSKERIRVKLGMLIFASNATYDEFVYIIKKSGAIIPKTTAEIKVEKGDIIKHFKQKVEWNQIYCKVSVIKNDEGVLNEIKTFALENCIESVEENAEFLEQEKELIKQKYF